MSLYILGDVHGDFGRLNTFINKKFPQRVICAGDFGFWPGHKEFELSKIKNRFTEVLWIDGNHENIEKIQEIIGNSRELTPIQNITYCPRGSTLTLPDGRKILFMGGASSIDKHWRTPGYDWFWQEDISYKDMEALPDEEIDIVISHTCPSSFLNTMLSKDARKFNDPAYEYLEFILDKYKPKLWFFGHWHCRKEGFNKGCKWVALN